MFVATAMAITLTEHIKMPPSIVLDYLVHFNGLMDVYRENSEQFQKDQKTLEKNFAMNQTVKTFLQEGKNNDEK